MELIEGDGGIRQVLSDALGESRAHIDADLAAVSYTHLTLPTIYSV